MPAAVDDWVAVACSSASLFACLIDCSYYFTVTFLAGLTLSDCSGWTDTPGLALIYFGVPLCVMAVWIGTAVFWSKSAAKRKGGVAKGQSSWV